MNERTQRIRETIGGFIEERFVAKSKGGKDDDVLASKYGYDAWLADAARRVGQIQAVTHVLKATHPDAKGSSLYVRPKQLPERPEAGSHALGETYAEDIVGNAAALDVYKLLKLEVEGRRLLDWLQSEDSDLLAALSDDPAVAVAHAAAFRSLVRPAETYASHLNAKQLYWCIGEDATDDTQYHLLQPMFPSSLMHAVHANIQRSRFDDDVVEMRKARRENKPHHGVEPEYQGLGVRKLGGTKPQNVSQLNSERGGINYLLASLPPEWKQGRPREFLRVTTAIPRFEYFEDVRALLKAYIKHVKSYDQRRHAQDDKRRRLERRLGTMLGVFGVTTAQSFEPGWTRQVECNLAECEKLWLDPGRRTLQCREQANDPEGHEDDLAFNKAFDHQDWPDEVAARFAKWLSDRLRKEDVPTGDVELRHFAREAVVDAVDWPNPMRRDLPNKRQWNTGVAS
ncbi:type I-F CRISPR-associated protein Csy1 [Lysobacter pythonis]|uniref:Type I-F CRISPR-associated protein Csy1 n=1 Tax=Solilutibacter pythonis TaxID=2483112 RepID=A0A3M2HH70_9GAMM|nr:type I-F CRISPR-associated protein Csy1 [Lysobacter pythonis]RMH89056.1 type I-F CRISPR-associated protein Csy1 [Lysobacter pythonis]